MPKQKFTYSSYKKPNGEITKSRKEYLESWTRYVKFLDSVGLRVGGFDPGFQCSWKEFDEDRNGQTYTCGPVEQLSVALVDLMIKLKESK